MPTTIVRKHNGHRSRTVAPSRPLATAASIVGKTVALGTLAVGIAQLATRREEATRAIRRITGRRRARIRRTRIRRAALATGVLALVAAIPFLIRHQTNGLNPFNDDLRRGS